MNTKYVWSLRTKNVHLFSIRDHDFLKGEKKLKKKATNAKPSDALSQVFVIFHPRLQFQAQAPYAAQTRPSTKTFEGSPVNKCPEVMTAGQAGRLLLLLFPGSGEVVRVET